MPGRVQGLSGMTKESQFDGQAMDRSRHDAATVWAARQQAHAAEVMADLADATELTIASLPQELPVEAAVACGNCRLYGGVEPQVVFPAWLATVAAHRLAGLLDQATGDARRLDELWDAATGDEAEDLVAGLLHARMDAWAASLQLDDVLEHSADAATRPALEAAIDEFDAALEQFDTALDTRQDYLATLAGTQLLRNFRSMLASPHRDPLPWWLDGRLEKRAEDVDAAIDSLIAETLFEPAGRPSVAPPRLTIGRLRAATSQTFAAAAAAAAAPSAGTRLRWLSPDRRHTATLFAPAVTKPTPDRLVVDFTNVAGEPTLELVGQRCLLATARSVIEKRSIDGIDRAVASFPGADVLDRSRADDQTVELTVGDDSTGWTLVAS